MSIIGQLMSCWDQRVHSAEEGPVALSALLAHLLFLAANGGLEFATALADTFGTETFLAAATVSRVPREFIEDISFDTSVQIPEGKPLSIPSLSSAWWWQYWTRHRRHHAPLQTHTELYRIRNFKFNNKLQEQPLDVVLCS